MNQKCMLLPCLVLLLSACSSSNTSIIEGEFTSNIEPYSCNLEQAEKFNSLRIYQIMVESFVNGDSDIGHNVGYGQSHHMGDIQGVIDSLDYIQSLGMNAIWLTPVFYSKPHYGQDLWADKLDATGYFATNYFMIDPRFGDLELARELVNEAHARGLYVFFDGVFGHHKRRGIEFSPKGRRPYGSSGSVDYPQSLEFYQEVATYWINELKIDGWRLDQAYQVPTEAWTQIRKAVDEASQSVTYTNSEGQEVNPLGYMVAEIWNGEDYIAETGYGSTQDPALCSAFDFPMRYRIVETLAVNESSVGDRAADWLNNGFTTHQAYPAHAQPNLMIGNHDLVRFGDLLQRGDIAQPNDEEYWLRHKAAFAFQAAYTGPITLYYGDEIGDQVDGFAAKEDINTCAIRGVCDDHVARSSAKIEGVTATLDANQADLKEYVSTLMNLREDYPALYQGVRTNITSNGDIYVDMKQSGDEQIVFALNIGESHQSLTYSQAELGIEGALKDLLSNESIAVSNGVLEIELEPFEGRFLIAE